MGNTHFSGSILGSSAAGKGLYKNAPLEFMAPYSWSRYFTDFHNLESEWVATAITSGTIDILQDTTLGILDITATTQNEGLGSVQYTGGDLSSEGVAVPASGRTIIYECRATMTLPGDTDWFIGLAETDTTFMSAAGAILANGGDNHIGFTHLEAGSGVPILTYAGTAVANVANPNSSYSSAPGAGTTFGIRIEGTNLVRFYINREPVSDWITMGTAFDDAMTPTFALIANGNAAHNYVDWVQVLQTR